MKQLITLLRVNLIFQGVIVLLLYLWPILVNWPLEKDLAATGFLNGVVLLVYLSTLVYLYRLRQGVQYPYTVFVGLLIIAPLMRDKVFDKPVSLELTLCITYALTVALTCFSSLRRRLEPPSGSSPMPRWTLWLAGFAIVLSFINGADRHWRNGKEKKEKAVEHLKLEELQNVTP